MKIGIFTFQNAKNYGALLQSYALKYTLNCMGNKTELINYYCRAIQYEGPIVDLKSIKGIIKTPIRLLVYPVKMHIAAKFASFRKKYLTDTPVYYPDTVKRIPNYDLFITGSDQVLNPRITGCDPNYFLAFSPNKTKNVSYAASFGFELKDFSQKEKDFIKQNLPHISHLSIREKQGENIVKTLTARTAQIHLDPVFLLTKKDWQSVAKLPKRKSPYILLYLMYKDDALISFAKKLAKDKKCQLLYISPKLDIRNRVPVKHITPTPQEWLGLFLNAQYIVTNSFHGLAFAINFNKPFFIGKLPPTWPAISRLENLLTLTKLGGRVYTNLKTNYNKHIDWPSVNLCIDKERQKALDYLKEITKERKRYV